MILQLFIELLYQEESLCLLGGEEARPHLYVIRHLLVPEVGVRASQLRKSLLYSLIAHNFDRADRAELVP